MAAESEFPDIYADGISVGVGPYGVTITLLLSDPLSTSEEARFPGRIVGRFRLSPQLARALAESLRQASKGAPRPEIKIERAR